MRDGDGEMNRREKIALLYTLLFFYASVMNAGGVLALLFFVLGLGSGLWFVFAGPRRV